MIFSAGIAAISYYLIHAINDLPKLKQSISSLFSKGSKQLNTTDKFKKSQTKYHIDKLRLDRELLDLKKRKQSLNKNDKRESFELKRIELELKTEISAKRFELLQKFQRENIDLKWAEIKLDWDGKSNWFSNINRFETEQILSRYSDTLLILTSFPKISKDSSLSIFRNLDFELQMRNLEDFIEKEYPSKKTSHPVKHFSNYFKKPIGKIEVEQLHEILNRISTYVIYPDITENLVSFRIAYWYINGELDFFSEPFKWNWKETQKQLIAEGKTVKQSILIIRDMFVGFHKILTAFWIDYYYLSIDPFYEIKISSLEKEADIKSILLQEQLKKAFQTLQNQKYKHYLDNLQSKEEIMDNTNKNQQSEKILNNLQLLFSDRPEVLRLLDLKNLDTDRIAGEVILENYRNHEGFASIVNFYVTGRTRAGKTSLGNTLFSGNQETMKSTGRMDCTNTVNCFKSANNLQYFDLPGAGSQEDYENINRVALCLKQIEMMEIEYDDIDEFILRDFTDYKNSQEPKDTTVSVEQWQSPENQLAYGADVILYVLAPHEGIGRDDRKYMFDLLSTQQRKRDVCNIVFALNLHLTSSGEPKYTKANLKDVEDTINKCYKKVYPDNSHLPEIIRINSLTGVGADKIAEEICKLLPADKLGKMEEVLGDKLKEKARKVRSKKFRQALIYIASRLATSKVNQAFDNDADIVCGTYGAIYSYASKVFKNSGSSQENVYNIVDRIASKTKKNATKDETVKEATYGKKDIYTPIAIPEFGEVKETHQVVVNDYKEVDNKRGLKFWEDKKKDQEFQKVVTLESTKTVQTGTRIQREKTGSVTDITGYVEKKVGETYLKGGYDFIFGVLSIGLGIEEAYEVSSKITDFSTMHAAGERKVERIIGKLKNDIEQTVNNYDPKVAENKLIKLLEQAIL